MNVKHQRGKLEVFVDGNLLEQAENGNQQAIREVAELAASHIRRISERSVTGVDKLTNFVVRALETIASSSTPNEAFYWSKCRKQPKNNAFLEWNLAQYVKNILPEVGGKVFIAIEIVGDAALMDGRKGGAVEKAYNRWKDVKMPDDIFPINPSTRDKLKRIEQRLPHALSKFQQK